MAWNPVPEVAAARDFGKKFGADRVVILYTTHQGQIGVASYGETRSLCDRTKPIADRLYEEAMKLFAEDDAR